MVLQYELPGKGEVDMGLRKTTKAFERCLEGLEWWLPEPNTPGHWRCLFDFMRERNLLITDHYLDGSTVLWLNCRLSRFGSRRKARSR